MSEKSGNNIEILDKNFCTGCGLCYNICPFGAITMEPSDEGFLYPSVNEKCVKCGLCANKCPQLSNEKISKIDQEYYAVQSIDLLRSKGSSGGVFAALSEEVIKRGGVVCGAAFDEGCRKLSHIIVDNKNDLNKIYKSKYVQSDVGDVYKIIRDLLKNNRTVLFSGCPCQVDALKSFLGKDYSNLLTIDILCHGVPSPMAYNKFLDEISDNNKKSIVSVDFRDKKFGWGTLIGVTFSDKSVHYDYYNGNYFRAFLSGLSMRNGCYNCKYSRPERVGDITLGDFWGAKEYNADFDDGKGTSIVICNTLKGKEYLKTVSQSFRLFTKLDNEKAFELSKRVNAAIARPTAAPKMRSCFFKHLQNGDSFSKSLRYAETSLIDVGILGWWIETPRSNYGSTLTNYALYNYIQSLGLSVAMISPPNFDRRYAGEFNKKYAYRMTAKYAPQDIKEINKYIDTFVVASDVLWYYDAFIKTGYFFMLDFVEDDKRKISYATSFGNTQRFFPDDEILKVHMLLSRFDHISVREYEAVDICKNRLAVQAVQVLDPVFICDPINYDLLAENAERQTQGEFLFAYILDPSIEKAEALNKISKKLRLKLVCVTDKQFNPDIKENILRRYGLLEKASIEELVYHIKNAKFVITDSYHGMCFSLIFRKSFITLINRARGASRFDTLAEDFGIKERMIESLDEVVNQEILLQPMDYTEISKRINQEVERSRQWLNNALITKKNKDLSEQEMLIKMLIKEIIKLKNNLSDLQTRFDLLEKKNNNR